MRAVLVVIANIVEEKPPQMAFHVRRNVSANRLKVRQTQGSNPWCEFDSLQRRLEKRASSLDLAVFFNSADKNSGPVHQVLAVVESGIS